MSDSVLKKFGKYFLLDRIGEGGMAEIFRARMASVNETGRLLVIKRIQGAYSNNPEFLQMFKAEVQVTMRFTHPNIVQLYEAGEESGQQFIAMELVDGRNLRQLLSKVSQKQQRIPVSASCFIIEQTAAGLHYAHTFKDRITGEAIHLVHRDVSPQNIIVSYDGNIKVIDFGIAKAANGEATRAGVIKGKLSYLAPEQVMGEKLDARSDVFALGIVLWELLTGRRLFVAEGDNEFQVLKMIESCNTFVKPPSTLNPAVSPELDAIVMQALSRDVKKRFQSAEEVAKALRKLLAVEYSDFGPSDLALFTKKLFHDLIVEDRKQLQNLNAKAEELLALTVPVISGPAETSYGPIAMQAPMVKDHTRMTNLGNKFDKSQITAADKVEISGQPQKQMKVPARLITVSKPHVSPVASVHHQATSSYSDYGQDEGGGLAKLFKFALTISVLGVAGFYGYEKYVKPSSALHDERTPSSQVEPLAVAPVAANLANVKMRIFPDGDFSHTRATLNSVPFDARTGMASVTLGELVALVVDRPGFVTFRKEFTVKDSDLNENREYLLDVKLEPMVYGTFTLSTQPEVSDVTIISLDQGTSGNAQRPLVLKSPIYQEKLPVGNYKVIVKNELLNVEKIFQIGIKEGDRLVKTGLPLEPARTSGNR